MKATWSMSAGPIRRMNVTGCSSLRPLPASSRSVRARAPAASIDDADAGVPRIADGEERSNGEGRPALQHQGSCGHAVTPEGPAYSGTSWFWRPSSDLLAVGWAAALRPEDPGRPTSTGNRGPVGGANGDGGGARAGSSAGVGGDRAASMEAQESEATGTSAALRAAAWPAIAGVMERAT